MSELGIHQGNQMTPGAEGAGFVFNGSPRQLGTRKSGMKLQNCRRKFNFAALECSCCAFSSLPCGRATRDIPAFFKTLWDGCVFLWQFPHRWRESRGRAGAGQRRQFLRDNRTRRDEHQLYPDWMRHRVSDQSERHLHESLLLWQLSDDGADPEAGLVQGSDSNFYGTTDAGGMASAPCFGSVPAAAKRIFTPLAAPPMGTLHRSGWCRAAMAISMARPKTAGRAPIALHGCGTVFRISPSGSYTILYSFADSTDGAKPYAGLVQDIDGNFYGTTVYGGTSTNCWHHGCGTVFKLDVGLGPISSNCTFSINPTNAVFGAAGGSDSVSVTASNGCDWFATNNDWFITITSDGSGSGNGTVRYTVAANTSTNDRLAR